MKNFLAISLLTLLSLTSCAGMQEEWIAKNCNYDAAYEQGNNDRENTEPMNSGAYSQNCVGQQKQDALKGYREGYSIARQQETPTATQGGASIKIGNTQINIGGSQNKKAFYCRIEAFTHRYDGFGATKVEATKAAQTECTKINHEMHCESVRCARNK